MVFHHHFVFFYVPFSFSFMPEIAPVASRHIALGRAFNRKKSKMGATKSPEVHVKSISLLHSFSDNWPPLVDRIPGLQLLNLSNEMRLPHGSFPREIHQLYILGY